MLDNLSPEGLGVLYPPSFEGCTVVDWMVSCVLQCSVKLWHFSKFKDMTDALAGARERER